MIFSIEAVLFWGAALIFLSVIASKLSDKFAVPALLIFLVIGMLAGSEGPGGVYFNDPLIAKAIGIVALIFIIFSGGINTPWKEARLVLSRGIVLSTLGVLVTAAIVGGFTVFFLKFSFLEGLLLGSIISSTDAAAVFSVLKSRKISLKTPLKPLLEFESGSNDPMAVFLTIGIIHLLTTQTTNLASLIPMFFVNMAFGGLVGVGMARVSIYVINRVKLEYADLYPVLTISLVILTYSIASFFKGNGFLAVYLVGLILSNNNFMHKKTILRFHESLAWIMQIVMFLTLGLLVNPSQIVPFIGPGLILAVVLMFLARPLSVFLCLAPFKCGTREKIMVSWVGLRGAAPIILATFPLLANVRLAHDIFNIIFFVVLTSVLIQGTSIPLVSKLLHVSVPLSYRRQRMLEMADVEGFDAELTDIIVPYDSEVVGKRILDLHFSERCLVVVISRDDKFIIPSGSTVLQGGDVLQIIASKADLLNCQKMISRLSD